AGDLFDGQAAFEVVQIFPVFLLDRLRREKRIVELVILVFRHWTIDVIRRPFVIAGRQVHLAHVDGTGFDDGADGIVKVQVAGARTGRAETRNLARQVVRGQRAGG